jgi:hypothetical protein
VWAELNNVKLVANKAGKFGRLDEKSYYKFIDTVMNWYLGLRRISPFIKTKAEIEEGGKRFSEFSDLQLDALYEFVGSIDKGDIFDAYMNIKEFLVNCPTDILQVIGAFEIFSVGQVNERGEIDEDSSKTFYGKIYTHAQDFMEFTSFELIELTILFKNVMGIVNHFVLSSFLGFSEENDEESENVISIQKSFNDWLQRNGEELQELRVAASDVLKSYPPCGNDMLSNPVIASKFLETIGSDEVMEELLDYVDYITVEDMNAVIKGTLVVDEVFLDILRDRSVEGD